MQNLADVNDEKKVKPTLAERYKKVRDFSNKLCGPLETEDYVIQSMPDVSPARWHLAHVTWFFETFVLSEYMPDYKVFDPNYAYLFNSYYVQAGERFSRSHRGVLSRPTVKDIFRYRAHVDEQMADLLNREESLQNSGLQVTTEIGINHEQQHQELMLTDLKHIFSFNPLYPIYKERRELPDEHSLQPIEWISYEGGVKEIGHEGDSFFYDNEKPRHKVYLNDYKLASRLVSNGEYFKFIEDGGYEDPVLWLSDGIAQVEKEGWKAPLYWFKEDGEWYCYALSGKKKVNPYEPVTHVSYYEADAFARWAGARLATEAEWENAAAKLEVKGNFADNGIFHPMILKSGESGKPQQMFGDVWEWTQSPYMPYPGYKIPEGAIGEYNGKFMANQYVLKGGSCATSRSHIRATYRNFFYPHQRWQFTGIRLAKDAEE